MTENSTIAPHAAGVATAPPPAFATLAEVDLQITTAKRYPRSVDVALARILTIATLDEETAADCFYSLRRGAGQGEQPIEGISVRLAEIIAGAWGNIRVQTFIVGNDGRAITACAICHDLETNFAVSLNVQRGILDRYGRPYSPDMQVVTGNAAMAIAFRNAVLKVVPKAVTHRVVQQIRDVAEGRVRNLSESRLAMVEYFAGLGVQPPRLLAYLGAARLEDIDARMVMELRGLANALREGTATLDSVFPPEPTGAPGADATAQRLMAQAASIRARVAAAARRARMETTSAPADPADAPAPAEGEGPAASNVNL